MPARTIDQSFGDSVEPIAIVGTSCRLPGEASTLEGFQSMLENARRVDGEVPKSRWNAEKFYHPNSDRKGTINNTRGFYLEEDVSLFDAPFFSLTGKEAAGMDPAQRLLLEVSYECFENAGIPTGDLPKSKTSVYAGCMTNDYELLSTRDPYDMGPNAASGNGRTMLANRVSWFFDLRGPSMQLDTACSSSLTALHLACQSLRLNESRQALVLGANLLLYPNFPSRLTDMHMLSKDGVSHSFDERANGYGRGEGFGAVVVKPLSAALEDGDTIRAVIRGSGANIDGKTQGITQPSAEAQADLIRTVYTEAGLSPDDTSYFEAHGTGTGLGDPTELSGIGSALGQQRSKDLPPLYVGSVKSNIGHTEGTAGIAGVLKAVHCLEKGVLVPNAGFENLNPKIKLDEWGIRFPKEVMQWPDQGLRRVSVNSFGFGGSNAHVVIDDALHYMKARSITGNHKTVGESGLQIASTEDGSQKMIFSFASQDQQGLSRLSQAYADFLDKADKTKLDESWLRDLAYTLSERRSMFDFRSYLVADGLESLQQQLQKGLAKHKRATKVEAIIGVFTGQGAQWPRMGGALLSNPIVRTNLEQTQSYLEGMGCEWNVLEVLGTEDKRISQPDFSQPVCTALQLALVDLLGHWGIQFKAVVGHSSGEIGAAYAAGFLTHEDAIKIAFWRGVYSADVNRRLQGKVGSMMAAGLSEEEAQPYIDFVAPGSVVVACINSPSSVTLSGDDDALTQLESILKEDGKFARKLRTGTAYHSPRMQVITEDYRQSLASIQPRQPKESSTLMFSSVSKKLLDGQEVGADYWVANMANPVQFSGATEALLQHSESKGRRKTPIAWSAAIELGPHEALKGPFNQIMSKVDSRLSQKLTYTAPVLRGQDSIDTAMKAAGNLWATGHSIDLARVNSLEASKKLALTDLPPYPWNHSKGFWHESRSSVESRLGVHGRTDLLGVPVEGQIPSAPRWRNYLRVSENPWIEDHNITGTILYPGAGMLIMAIEGANQIRDLNKSLRGFELQDVAFEKALAVPAGDEGVETSLTFSPHSSTPDCYEWAVFSRASKGDWLKNSYGMISIMYQDSGGVSEQNIEAGFKADFDNIKATATQKVEPESFYEQLQSIGMVYGPLFANMTSAAAAPSSNDAYGTVRIPDTASSMPEGFEFEHLIHPATLDAIFHLLFVGFHQGRAMADSAVPIHMDRLFLSSQQLAGAGSEYSVAAKTTHKERLEQTGTLLVTNEQEQDCKILVENLRVKQVSDNADSLGLKNAQCAQTKWAADIDFLEGSTVGVSLETYLQILSHKQANLKVLVICDGRPSPDLLALIQKTAETSFASCELRVPDDSVASHVRAILGESPIDISLAQQESEDVKGDRDLVVASLSNAQEEVVHDFVASAKRHTSVASGKLILATSAMGQDATLTALDRCGLHATHPLSNSHGAAAVGSTRAVQSFADKDVVLLEGNDAGSSFASKLTLELEKRDCHVETTNLAQTGSLEGKLVVSLLEAEDPLIVRWSDVQFRAFQRLVSTAEYVLWVTPRGDVIDAESLDFGPATGLLRTLRLEYPQLTMPQLDLNGLAVQDPARAAALVCQTLQHTTKESSGWNESEFRIIDGVVHIPRVVDDSSLNEELDLHSSHPQPKLSTLAADHRALKMSTSNGKAHFEQSEVTSEPLGLNEVEIRTTATTLTRGSEKHEIMGTVIKAGLHVKSCKPGDAVLTVCGEIIGNVVRASQHSVLPVPAEVQQSDFIASAGVYAEALHVLRDVVYLKTGETILVDASLSAFGQAVRNVAANGGANVYCAASSADEQNKLTIDHKVDFKTVLRTDSTFFVPDSLRVTGKQGFDVILSVSKSHALRKISSTLGLNGRFVDTTGRLNAADLAPNAFSKNGTLRSVHFDQITSSEKQSSAVDAARLIERSTVPVLQDVANFSIAELDAAMESIKTGRASAVGKAVVNFDDKAQVLIMPEIPAPLSLDGTASYVLSGGLGALGLSIANYMADHGARHLIFLSRSGASTETQQQALAALEKKGCKADAVKCDVCDSASMKEFAGQCQKRGWRVKGVIQAAMVMRDNVFENMTYGNWRKVVDPKVVGTWNLHKYLPDDMSFFIILSSIIGIIGNTSQANYGTGNSFQDAFAHYRNETLGLPTTSLNVGLVSDASHFTPDYTIEDYLAQYGHMAAVQINQHELNVVLSAAMRGHTADGRPVPAQIIPGIDDDLERSGAATTLWPMDRKFDHRIASGGGTSDDGGFNVQAELGNATSLPEAGKTVETALRASVAASITAEPGDIDVEQPLSSYGVDSLKAVEVRNWIFRELKANVSVFDVLSPITIESFANKIAGESKLVSAEVSKEAAAAA
ncbi:hypothetical protein M409DRAFT_53800 [Zasmidium cellare ATCC 36951]|uniref:Uncharacterized protein n=1 Tax=Zasmidium cellare ATCC 36951 TaxID=1080233 RepID=A0A6A6CLC1_ZASCE|nr:uncharacterized protein M409DRAFT_53800 [Zasmidium cellare ATCC 36951]KAF2167841.1 hypothetical protein M409DRAFT_53800 [Zasmidium cellare ATCC 36951]